MTVKWTSYAQSLTKKPMKGMLTGPVTILNWSFPRADISKEMQSKQLALALRDEVIDLEKAGIHAIQVDEPAIREGVRHCIAFRGFAFANLKLLRSSLYASILPVMPSFRSAASTGMRT